MEKSINKRLLAIRNYLDLSQRAFCSKLGICQATYQPLERDGQDIREVYIKMICQVYNVNEDYLRNGIGEMFIEEPDRKLEEILEIYDNLSPSLQNFLLKQAQELKELNNEMKSD